VGPAPRGADPEPSRWLPEHAASGCHVPGLRNLAHRQLADAEAFYASLARVAPVRQLRIHTPLQHFDQWAGVLEVGSAALLSISSSNVSFAVEAPTDVHLVAAFAGQRRIGCAFGDATCTAGGMAMVPIDDRTVAGSFSGAVVALRPARISQVAAAMAGRTAAPHTEEARFARFAPLSCPDGPQARMVHALLHAIDPAAGVNPRLPAQLGYDDSLHRLVATLLQPALVHQEPADLQRWRERDGRRAFDALLDYIGANLDQPLRLSDLEARSHYSSRALQYAFRERLGCTPKQWIRQQRLERALEQLQHSERDTPIRAIAWACGYRHLGLFSADFKRRFGCSPSQLRRGGGLHS